MQFKCTPPLFDVMVAFKLEIISSISIKFDIVENCIITTLKRQLISVFNIMLFIRRYSISIRILAINDDNNCCNLKTT